MNMTALSFGLLIEAGLTMLKDFSGSYFLTSTQKYSLFISVRLVKSSSDHLYDHILLFRCHLVIA
ncbi:MAG: hypothetical protein IK090_06175, partial [Clostridia bacterium]|nr:hypothetical protein [Clostridia bacterium]